MVNVCNNIPVEIRGWKVTCNGYGFIARKDGIHLFFEAEYKNGLYFKIKSVTYNGKSYTAQRYHYKWIAETREIAFELLRGNYLWDYINGCPAYDTWQKDLIPYHNRLKQLGIEE